MQISFRGLNVGSNTVCCVLGGLRFPAHLQWKVGSNQPLISCLSITSLWKYCGGLHVKLHSWMSSVSTCAALAQNCGFSNTTQPTHLALSELWHVSTAGFCSSFGRVWVMHLHTTYTLYTTSWYLAPNFTADWMSAVQILRKCPVFMPVQRNVIFGVELVQTTDLRGRAGKV